MVGCSLYRFFDAEGRLLYVGITSRGPNRWQEQKAHRAWWDLVARTTVEHFADRKEAMAAERAAIRDEHPLHNVVHSIPRQPRPMPVYRAHGTGSIHQRADTGKWMVAVTIDGRRFMTSFAEEDEARLFLAAAQYRNVRPAGRLRAIEVLEAGPGWHPRGRTR